MGLGYNNIKISSSMDLTRIAKDLIRNSIRDYMKKNRVSTTSPLDHIFPVERRIRSIMGGLETSMGTKFWERLTFDIAKKNNFEVKSHKDFNESVPKIPQSVMHRLSDFEEKKKNKPELTHQDFFKEISEFIKRENLASKVKGNRKKIPKGTGVDVWLKKDGVEYLADIKTVQINTGSGVKFNRNLLEWYTYRALDGISNIRCWIIFPYNPHTVNYWQKEKGKVEPLIPSVEAKVESEFWDFLSGQKESYEKIEDAFKQLSKEGFSEEFRNTFYQ